MKKTATQIGYQTMTDVIVRLRVEEDYTNSEAYTAVAKKKLESMSVRLEIRSGQALFITWLEQRIES